MSKLKQFKDALMGLSELMHNIFLKYGNLHSFYASTPLSIRHFDKGKAKQEYEKERKALTLLPTSD